MFDNIHLCPSSILLDRFYDLDLMPRMIEEKARICYRSEDKITAISAEKLIKSLIKRDHTAMLEHGLIGMSIIADRGVLAEITRHRLMSFAVMSTRYCNYDNKFDFNYVIPSTFYEWSPDAQDVFFDSIVNASMNYKSLSRKGLTPEQCRAVLPNALMTKIGITINLREFRTMAKLRGARAAHPDFRILMSQMYEALLINGLPEYLIEDLPDDGKVMNIKYHQYIDDCIEAFVQYKQSRGDD
jgi:thymidylate synthase (FAD)